MQTQPLKSTFAFLDLLSTPTVHPTRTYVPPQPVEVQASVTVSVDNNEDWFDFN